MTTGATGCRDPVGCAKVRRCAHAASGRRTPLLPRPRSSAVRRSGSPAAGRDRARSGRERRRTKRRTVNRRGGNAPRKCEKPATIRIIGYRMSAPRDPIRRRDPARCACGAAVAVRGFQGGFSFFSFNSGGVKPDPRGSYPTDHGRPGRRATSVKRSEDTRTTTTDPGPCSLHATLDVGPRGLAAPPDRRPRGGAPRAWD